MSGEPPSNADRDRLPFEPKKGRKAKANNTAEPAAEPAAEPKPKARPLNPLPPSSKQTQRPAGKSGADRSDHRPAGRRYTREEMAIPDVVNRRMVKRMAVFCGIPTGIGFASFFAGYWVNTSGLFELPNVAVLLSSLGGLGLGVIGLTYGVLSASWEEDAPGSVLGIDEFRVNFDRMRGSWRDAREARSRNNS